MPRQIANSSKALERVYFLMPSFCERLSKETKDKLNWTVDRQAGKQLISFYAMITKLHDAMKWEGSCTSTERGRCS